MKQILSIFFLVLSTQLCMAQMTIGSMRVGQGVTSPSDWVTYRAANSDGTVYGGVYVTVNTSNCNFTSVPHYLVTLEADTEANRGGSGMWEVSGYTAIYNPTPTSFRVYARWVDGRLNVDQQFPGFSRDLDARHADRFEYIIRWTAIDIGDCSGCRGQGPRAIGADLGSPVNSSRDETMTGDSMRKDDIDPWDMEIFPNPSTSSITIKLNREISGINFYNVTGELIESHNQGGVIDVSHLNSGTYVVVAQFVDGSMLAKKFEKL